jgi:hypothetical protein
VRVFQSKFVSGTIVQARAGSATLNQDTAYAPVEAGMCRNIRTLFNFEPPATEAEVHAAAVQFVRKVSGFNSPSKSNQAAFDRAVEEIATAAGTLIGALVTSAEPRGRDVEVARARARAAVRFGR